jgi:16S rRNA processing protein RimM
VDDRGAADALRGARIFVPKSGFPAAQKDEYYWVDLIGLDVINREGQRLGLVRDLLSTGPQTVLVIDDIQEAQTVERMIPFVAAYIDDVNLTERRILVDWQPDY